MQYQDIIDVLISERDSGQSEAINKGFQMATGDIVTWLNADDLYFPDTISRVVSHFSENPDIDIIYGDSAVINGAGLFYRYFTEAGQCSYHQIRNFTNPIMLPSAFFRRHTIERVELLDSTLHYTMDWDL